MPTTINGRQIALEGTMPLTVGDWRKLQKLGVTPKRLQAGFDDVDAMAQVALYALQKADASVTEAEVDALTFDQLADLLAAAAPAAAVDRPTSTPSSSSDGPSAGAPETSRV